MRGIQQSINPNLVRYCSKDMVNVAYHRGDPLASMDISVPDNGGLRSRTTGAEDVDTLDGTTSN